MSGELQFEPEVGRNITLSKDRKEATWTPVDSGGWIYSACAMKTGGAILLELQGSGHCVVGVTTENPDAKGAMKQMLKMKKMNDIRLHKRTCKIQLALQDNGKEVSTMFEGNTVTKKVGKAAQVWVAVYVKFGDVSMTLRTKESPEGTLSFSSHHGPNMRVEDGKLKAATVSNNPAAISLLKIKAGEKITMQCSPITEGSRDPSRYHLDIKLANRPPSELKRYFPNMFDASLQNESLPTLMSLELLEKPVCKGELNVSLGTDNWIEYTTSSGKSSKQKLNSNKIGTIVIELYRVSVKLLKKEAITCPVRPRGNNVVDSRTRDPSNVKSENSMDVFQSMCPSQPKFENYVSVTEAKRVMSSQFNTPTINEYTSTAEAEIIWQRMDRMEQKQEEIFQLIEDSLSRQGGVSSSLCPSCVSSELDEVLSSALQTNWVELINTMRVDVLCDHLYQAEILDEHDMHRILNLYKEDQRDANRRLLRILLKKRIKKSTLATILDHAQESHLKPLFFPEDFK